MPSGSGRSGAAWSGARCGRWELQESSYSRSTIIRWRWFQIRVRSSSSRRQLPIHRSISGFILGACTAEWMTVIPADWKTAPDAALKLASPVMQHKPRPDAGVIEIHQEVPGLLHHRGLDRVLRCSENPGPAATVFDDGQDVHLG